jgi:protease-4
LDYSLQSDCQQGVADIGIRPFGNSRLTLFGDMAMREKTKFNEAPWSAGAVFEIIPGINLTGRYFRNEKFTAGLTINFGMASIGSQLYFDDKQDHTQNAYSYRVGGMRPSVFPGLVDKDKRYLKIDLEGRITYQDYMFFNSGNNKFLDILRDLQAAGDDPRIALVAINISSMSVAPEHAWEIREELKKLQAKGKKVIIFTDRCGITNYHLASVADKIVLDPEGMINIFGYALGNTYFKGTLAKLGLGFDEWRFFKYKSAAEVLSRDNMSDADREQIQAFTDDLYETVRKDVRQSRSLSDSMFDYLVDEQTVFLPNVALERNLVDTLARWSDIDKIIEKTMGEKLRPMARNELFANAMPPVQWGMLPEVAVVYGLGTCALDSGIKARWLEKEFLKLSNDRSVKAVVFRVDSPGGDGLASDMVAEALKKCAARKPVIVSQGQVAGSGGYWISMYGDKILAGPTSITGSIGVIGGWLYDKGFSEKLGMTSEYVKRGKHADLGHGVVIPFLNLTVPSRTLNDEERVSMEKIIRELYDNFVGKVAAGRHMTVDEVKAVAQGRFYSGLDGLEAGLIDEIGGVMLAIEIAKNQAGLKPDQEISIKEVPKYRGLFGFDSPFPFAKAHILEQEPAYEYIKMINEARGGGLPMIPPGTYPEAE